ncbi:TetR/AcrR family transcriptional regulator [Bradyrhizobium sp.]|uniref:TetR/AcrR family transcriptional regulator n=1 Tax=Bradyrhizobium sp. TaxID=376 RepID=UPI003C4040D5
MRYEKGHKDLTRQRIIDVASRRFRESGVAAAGLAGIMAEAGLTNGAFYAHFDSKEDLLRCVLSDALGRREQKLKAALERGAGLQATIESYLSPRHRDDPGSGCPTAAMVAEIARHPKATRNAFTGKVEELIAVMAAQIGAGSAEQRRNKAMAIYATMIGTLQLARAVGDKGLSDEILQNGIDAALALVDRRD